MKAALPILLAFLSLFGGNAVLAKNDNEDLKLQYKIVTQDSLASAMMLGLANQDTAFIFDKVENNRAKTASGKPTWASLVNLTDYSVRGIDATTNPFCAAGSTLGNGSYIVVGGNSAISYGGINVKNQDGSISSGPAAPYQDYDGRRVVRLMQPNEDSSQLEWIDEYNSPNQMDSPRWYPGVEGLADGSVVLIGGATNGGFINRNYPNVDPAYATDNPNPTPGKWDQGGANPSYEFWPPTNKPKPAVHDFMVKTSGLNMYAHTYLMPSGRIFMQANYSTTLWDWQKDSYHDLPDMPDQIIRVYPASGATAMMPLTPANKYTPTILFCGGFNNITDEQWGDYKAPRVNMFEQPGSTDCSSITPENADGSNVENVQYVREETLPEPRSMGQFIHLPTGQMVIVNGASRGVAGYGNTTWNTAKDKQGNVVHMEGMSQKPTYRPVLFDPEQPKGKRLKYEGFGSSKIARLYHSSAILVPDGSVLVAGSNPHMDVARLPPNDQIDSQYEAFNTTYVLEQWYPEYYFEPRPKPQGMPDVIKYGGKSFNVTIDANYMNPDNNANDMANKTKFMVIRPGFSTHAVNFGQRSLQLENSYEVHHDGSVTFIVNPMPTNMNIFVPGPALLFATVNGIPSHGKYVFLGGKGLGDVPLNLKPGDEPPRLPAPVNNNNFQKNAPSPGSRTDDDDGLSGGAIAGIVVGVVVGSVLLAALAFLLWRMKRNQQNAANYASIGRPASTQTMGTTPNAWTRVGTPYSAPHAAPTMQTNESRASLLGSTTNVSMLPHDAAEAPLSTVIPITGMTKSQPASEFSASTPQSTSQALAPPMFGPRPLMTSESTNEVQTYYVPPSTSQGPVLMPESTTHWNDIPARMTGPRDMPGSNLQHHLIASSNRYPTPDE